MNGMMRKVEVIRRKYMARMDAGEPDGQTEGKKTGNTRLPYGLCKSVGIDTEGMSPKEAWEAYYTKTGVKPEEAYKEHFTKTAAAGSKKYNEEAIAKSVKKIEDKIRNDKVETAALVGSDGEVLFDKSDGLAGYVYFTKEETAMMKDSVLTHNHPKGTTFSDDDIVTAFSYGLKTIRAAHSKGCYILDRNFEIGDQIPDYYQNFASDYDVAVKKYMTDVVDDIWAKTNDADRCNTMVADYRRKWLGENSEKYGWTYREE